MERVESELITQAQEGSHHALNELLSKEQKFLLNLMYQLTGDRAEADDLAQEALILAYRKIRSFRHEASFRTWLSKIAINLFRQRHRRKKKHVPVDVEHIKIPSDKGNPERMVIKSELQTCIIHNLQHHLPGKYRMVLVLRDLQDFSYQEISEVLGWSIGKTKIRLHRARQMFRSFFVNEGCRAFTEDYRCVCEGILDL